MMSSRDSTLPPKQTGSSAWIGSDLAKRDNEWLEHLSPAEISELERAAEPLVNDSFNIGAMTQAQFVLPNLSQKLDVLRNELISGRGFSVLRGLPVSSYTLPASWRRHHGCDNTPDNLIPVSVCFQLSP